MAIAPYLFFEGRCEEAIEFYKQALGAEVEMLMRMRDSPEPPPPGTLPPDAGDKVLHASLRIGDATVMASDGHCSGNAAFQGFALSLPARDEAQAQRFFAALSEGGSVRLPLGKTFWSSCFGMVADRFGIVWMVGVDH
jgi:PhnB protein